MKRERSREGQINKYMASTHRKERKKESDVPLLEGWSVHVFIAKKKPLISTLQVLITSLILSYTLL